ncbi:uncharacterized protein LOC122544084 isoform X4 [Chiloscyllium plagiosum]|nr:uncharacterized protein LOC122544084 isoform X4 [Chiloscyllium plagiosum]
MQGNLLHGCSVLVTSRPWKMGNLTKTQINLRGEILGFNSENIKRYFRRCFGDEQLATGVMESIRQNETLYTMCYNPLYCSVLSSLLETRLREPEKQGPLLIPTSTEMFSAYITELLARCGYVVRKSLHKLKKIGELAWKGVSNKIVVFVSDQINQRELEDSNFISSFMMEIEDSSNVAYSFSHCVLQDFIAAVAKCLTTSTKGLVRQLDEGFTCSDNRFEIFSRFFTGLLSQNLNNQLENLLGDFPSEATRLVSVWLKDNIRRHIQKAGDMQSQRVFLQLLHCFIEFQDKPLISDTFLLLQSITLTQCLLKPSDCAALAFSFLYMEQVEELNLYACGIQDDCVRQLEPALPKCKILRLNRNDFGDSGINCLATALKKHDCKIQTLELKSNRLTDDSVEGLVSALVENSSLLELDLSNDKHDDELTNKLTEKCISSLYRLIKCKSNLKEIRLIHNRRITEEHQILNSTHLFNLVTVTDQDQNARMEILHSHDTDSKDTTHVISEEENPGPQENKHHGNGRNDCAAEGDNVAAAHNESMIAGPELSKHGERQQGSPSENDERPLGSMQPKQFQQDTLNQGELEGQNQNATMESLHSHDTDSIDTTHLIIEGENPGLQENKHHGNGRNDCTAVDGNVAAASIESTMAGSELSKDTVRHQGSPSENDEESVDSMHPKQFQKNALIQGELEHQEENTHMETIVIGDSSNEDVSPTNNLIEKWNPGLEEKKEHHSDTNTDGFDGDNKGNIGTLATAADIQQSKDSALQQDSIFKIKENMDENKEGNAMTATLCCKDNCNDIKLTAETNAESSRQLHPSGEHENSKNVSDIPVLHGDYMDPHKREEFSNMTTDSACFRHNRETQDGGNVQLPQNPLQDELQYCRVGHVENMIQFFSNTTPQNELDRVKSTPASPSPKRDPKTTGLQQKENISIIVPSDNMPPDGMNTFFDTPGRTKRIGTDDGAKLNEFLRNVSKYDLQALTTQFEQRLKDAVEVFGQQLVVNLLCKQLISDKESEHSRKLIKEKCNSEASKFIFDKVRTIGFVAVKTLWEICVNVDGVTPKLNEIRKDLLKTDKFTARTVSKC